MLRDILVLVEIDPVSGNFQMRRSDGTDRIGRQPDLRHQRRHRQIAGEMPRLVGISPEIRFDLFLGQSAVGILFIGILAKHLETDLITVQTVIDVRGIRLRRRERLIIARRRIVRFRAVARIFDATGRNDRRHAAKQNPSRIEAAFIFPHTNNPLNIQCKCRAFLKDRYLFFFQFDKNFKFR